MTVGSSLSKAGPFIADGVQKEFPYEFSLLDRTHIAVWVDGSRRLKDFTVTQNSVVFTEAPAEGSKVTLIRDVPFTQETDIQNNTAFFPEVIENALDKLTMISQQLEEKSERSLTFLPGEGGADLQSFIERVNDAEAAAAAAAAEAETAAEQTKRDSASVGEALQKSAGIPIGAIFSSPGEVPPEGTYLLNGQTIPNCAETYKKFWAWVNTVGVRIIDNATFEAELAQYGNCDGFVLDTAAGSVRLPKWKYQAPLGDTLKVRGNGMSIGLTDGTALIGIHERSGNPSVIDGAKELYGSAVGTSVSSGAGNDNNKSLGVTSDPDKSGIVAENNASADHFVWCIQVYNAATALSEQESAQLASLLQVKAGGDNIRKEAAMRVWESEEQTITYSTLYQLAHNLNLTDAEIRKARARIILKCVTAEYGYQVGDYVYNPTDDQSGQQHLFASPIVRSNTLLFAKLSGNFALNNLTSPGNYYAPNKANWRMIFQIFY